MTIHQYAEQLQKRITAERPTVELTNPAIISRVLNEINDVLSDLKDFIRRYTFSSVEEEISFFKEIKPVFISQLVYHKVLFKIQSRRSYASSADVNVIYKMYLKKFDRYLRKHEHFLQYCMAGSTRHDRLYFTRKGAVLQNLNYDENFTTQFDHKFGKFLGYQLVRDYIKSVQRRDDSSSLPTIPALAWTESKVSLIELAYALYASRAFDGGKVSIKQIIGVMEQLTGLDLSNYRRIFADIRLRKTGPTSFLDLLSRQYRQYVDSLP
jgi:hypothetical protein